MPLAAINITVIAVLVIGFYRRNYLINLPKVCVEDGGHKYFS